MVREVHGPKLRDTGRDSPTVLQRLCHDGFVTHSRPAAFLYGPKVHAPPIMTVPIQSFSQDSAIPELVAAARTGDTNALGVLYDRFGARLYRIALRLTGSSADAEDVVQDLFVGLPEALRRYDERGAVESWLVVAITRMALMHRRTMTRRREESLDVAAPDSLRISTSANANAGIMEQVERFSRRARLDDALSRLPESQRDVVLLRVVEGLSHDEIASAIGISPGASRVRFNRALDALRALIHHS